MAIANAVLMLAFKTLISQVKTSQEISITAIRIIISTDIGKKTIQAQQLGKSQAERFPNQITGH